MPSSVEAVASLTFQKQVAPPYADPRLLRLAKKAVARL